MKNLRNIIAMLLLAMSQVVMADNLAYLITVDENNGESSFSIEKISKITFDDSDMIVALTDGNTTRLPLAGLSKMLFSESGVTGIAAPDKNAAEQMRLSGGVLHVNAPQGTVVTLYNLGGQAVKTVTATGSDTQINVAGLTKGVYIVKVGNATKKITNK